MISQQYIWAWHVEITGFFGCILYFNTRFFSFTALQNDLALFIKTFFWHIVLHRSEYLIIKGPMSYVQRTSSIKNQNRCEKEHNGFQIIFEGKKVGNFKTMKNFKFFPWSSKNKPWKSFFDFEVDFYQDSQSTFVVATKQSLFNNVFLVSLNWTLDLKLKRAILWLDNTMWWPIKNDLARNWNKPKKDRPDQRTWRDDIKRPTVKNLSVMDPSMNLRIVRQKKCKEKIEKKVSSSHSNMRCVQKKNDSTINKR